MIAIGEGLDEGVEMGLSEADLHEGLLPNAMGWVCEVVFHLQRTPLSSH